MKNFLTILSTTAILMIFAVFLSGCTGGKRYDSGLSKRLRALDTLVADRSGYIRQKEDKIASLRDSLYRESGERKYELLGRLHDEYVNYNLDSAAYYCREKIACAEGLDDRKKASVSRLELAKVCSAMGNDLESIRNIEMVAGDTADSGIRLKYYDVIADYAERRGKPDTNLFKRMLQLIPDGPDRYFVKANILRYSGNPDAALNVLDSMIAVYPHGIHSCAIAQFIKGESYLQKKDTLGALRCFVESSINDLKTPVRDYRSVYRLASLLLHYGDTERAYDYITLAAQDIHSAAARKNVEAVGAILPNILMEYERSQTNEEHNQLMFMIGIASLTVLLSIALVAVALSRKQLSYVIVSEKELNRQLKSANEALASMNEKLKKANNVRISYLMEYVNLCSYYIQCLDSFRMNVSTALKTKGQKGVEKILAEADDDRQLREFYDIFDRTFLKLFPNFIEEFNRLVEPSKGIVLPKEGVMTNELRTFALIRLGITDSVKISQFLRRSVSTVYNYRVKMRNAAVGERDDFEKAVMEIDATTF